MALVLAFAGGCVDEPAEQRQRASALLRSGDPQAALKVCDRGLSASEDVSLLVLRSKALFELDRLAEARASYRKVIALAEGRSPRALAQAYHGLAIIDSRQQRWPAARLSFEQLIRLDKRDPVARINLARICLTSGDLACAVEHGEHARRLGDDREEVLFTLGRIYLTAARYRDAERAFEQICEVKPGASSCPYGVALVATQQGDRARALVKLREALRRGLPNPGSLSRDKLLAPLRDDPAFRELVAQVDISGE